MPVAHIHRGKKYFLSETESNRSSCLIVSDQVKKDLLKGHRGDWVETLGGWRVLLVHSGPGPTLIELDKEQRVFEGPPIDDGLHQVDEANNQ